MLISELPRDLSRRYKYTISATLFAGTWRINYELVGARGGVHLHVSGPHHYDGSDHYAAGLEYHSRSARGRNEPPSHNECWLLKCPCWHDGTSLYPQENYLPHVLRGDHAFVLRKLISDADDYFELKCEEANA